MFFYLSKIFWWLFEPGNILFLLLTFGVVFLFLNKIRLAKFFCGIAFAFYLIFGIVPFGAYLQTTLENRFPTVVDYPKEIDGIIVLGGMVDVYTTDQRGGLALNGNIDRVLSLYDLGERYPDVPIIFTGGAGLMGRPDLTEASMIQPLLEKIVSNPDRLVLENVSQNTYENALYTKDIIKEKASGTWLLVTSARHMPRSVAAFRHQGVNVLAYPVDYHTSPDPHYSVLLNPRQGLGVLRASLHEWLGLLAYYLTDKTSEFFPSP
ncbi:YdcF family protein [Terasakiella sp. A23]|uniref:YdcF family protein n=1 Tax=Terasakiella sp. FCG-A23 TaxID=3080561 RepID=UPI002953A372|nr:YdcF family protein [Terasakiella sp. A23]MDV7338583.1 YdcF family protein [Terasakiella sp. A23]